MFNGLLFVADRVLQVGDRLVALENKIDETLTESISILKQVTLSLFNIRFTTFPKIKKLMLDHDLRRALERNMLKNWDFPHLGIAIEHQYEKAIFLTHRIMSSKLLGLVNWCPSSAQRRQTLQMILRQDSWLVS